MPTGRYSILQRRRSGIVVVNHFLRTVWQGTLTPWPGRGVRATGLAVAATDLAVIPGVAAMSCCISWCRGRHGFGICKVIGCHRVVVLCEACLAFHCIVAALLCGCSISCTSRFFCFTPIDREGDAFKLATFVHALFALRPV